jgi:hypothetical protein
MDGMTRSDLVRELARIAVLIEHDALAGCVLIAIHPNSDVVVHIAPPNSKAGVDLLMAELDKLHFRLRVMMYLGPKGTASQLVKGSETEQ